MLLRAKLLAFCLLALFALLCARCQVDHLSPFVVTTRKAHVVRTMVRAAVTTLGERRLFERVVRAPILGVRSRMSHSNYHTL